LIGIFVFEVFTSDVTEAFVVFASVFFVVVFFETEKEDLVVLPAFSAQVCFFVTICRL
jgi:hypothetical protein